MLHLIMYSICTCTFHHQRTHQFFNMLWSLFHLYTLINDSRVTLTVSTDTQCLRYTQSISTLAAIRFLTSYNCISDWPSFVQTSFSGVTPAGSDYLSIMGRIAQRNKPCTSCLAVLQYPARHRYHHRVPPHRQTAYRHPPHTDWIS